MDLTMDSNLLPTVITSAAVGALASAVVAFVGQGLERRARRKELLLAKAIELAVGRRELVMRVAEASGKTADLWDDATVAAEYYGVLKHLLDKGDLPEGFKKKSEQTAEEPI